MSRVHPLNASTSSEENKETTDTLSVLHILNPVITWMRVFGVCIGPRVTVENIECGDNHFRQLHKDGWFHKLYSVLVNCFLWTFSGLLAYKVALLEPMSSEWIIAFQLLSLNVIASGYCTWASLNYRDGMYQSLMKDFYLYEQCCSVHKNMKAMVKKSRIFIAFVVSSGILSSPFLLTYAFVIPEVREIFSVVGKTLVWWNYLITVINYFILCTTISSSVILPVLGSYSFCSSLDVINTSMKRCVEEYIKRQESQTFPSESACENPYEKTEPLKDIIERHKHICSLIYGFGDSIAFILFTTFFMSLPLTCFSMYVIMTRMESQNNVLMSTCILLVVSLACIILSLAGVMVNIKAHAALQYIFKIPTANLSETTMREVNQITSRLTGTTIGYSVFGLFTINPPTLLSIVGTLVTYFVVVLQFRQPVSHTNPSSLCRELVANVTLLLEDMRNAS